MKVLATGMEWFTERPGGLPRYFSDYLDAWVTSEEDEIRGLVGVKSHVSVNSLPKHVRGVSLGMHGACSLRKRWKNAVLEEISSQSYDLWNPHFAYYAWGAANARSIKHVPIVCHFHGPWAYEARVEDPGVIRNIKFTIQKAIEHRVYKNSDQFIVLSEAFKEVLTRGYGVPGERVHVIPGAVDTEKFVPITEKDRVRHELSIPAEKTVLVSVRRLANRMGLDRLVSAMVTLVSEFPHLLLIIVGTGMLESELKAMVREFGLDKSVRFAGRVPDIELPKYYQAADVSVVPSAAWEGFGLVTTESLACGTPVVATPVGGIPEILGRFDSRLIFSGSETSDLVDGLRFILNGLHDLPCMEECRRYVLEHFTWPVIIPQIKEVFKSALTGRTGAPRGEIWNKMNSGTIH